MWTLMVLKQGEYNYWNLVQIQAVAVSVSAVNEFFTARNNHQTNRQKSQFHLRISLMKP